MKPKLPADFATSIFKDSPLRKTEDSTPSAVEQAPQYAADESPAARKQAMAPSEVPETEIEPRDAAPPKTPKRMRTKTMPTTEDEGQGRKRTFYITQAHEVEIETEVYNRRLSGVRATGSDVIREILENWVATRKRRASA